MGYMTALHLVNVRIKATSRPTVQRALQTRKGRGLTRIAIFLEEACLTDEAFLLFRSTGRFDSPFCPDAEDGTVPVLVGKWHDSDRIARWLKLHAEKGGQVIEHSYEADGAAWGWEFDGRGRLRELALTAVGKWS